MSRLSLAPISAPEHAAFLASQGSASFLQTPGWARVKSEWDSESLGWYDDGELTGAGLVLYRRLPRTKRCLAYLPEGPVIDWTDGRVDQRLAVLVEHLRTRKAFGVRIGPPVATRRWSAATVKAALAGEGATRLGDVPADVTEPAGADVGVRLRALGWRPPRDEAGFGAGQPRYVFQLPLAGRTADEVLKGMNQLWRRNIKKADKAGVVVDHLDPASADPKEFADAVARFHTLYAETATRDHFRPRPVSYFATMFEALSQGSAAEIRLYRATHEDDLVAATIWIRVGTHVWYSYGASSTAKRDVRGSNAVQWAMITDAIDAGADVYDLRGITDTLDSDDSHVGLVQFKVGTGGEAVEYAGEWDLPLNRPLYAAFDAYMRRR